MIDYFINTVTSLLDKNPMLYLGILVMIFASLAGLKFMKLNLIIHKQMRWPLFFTGIGFILMGVYIKVPSGYFSSTGNSEQSALISTKKEYTEKEIERFMESYFDALESHDFSKVSPYYAKVLEEFMGEKNIASTRVKKLLQASWAKVEKENYKIDQGSWKFSRDNFDNYLLSFAFKYFSVPKDYKKGDSETLQQYTAEVLIDKNLKLVKFRQNLVQDASNPTKK